MWREVVAVLEAGALAGQDLTGAHATNLLLLLQCSVRRATGSALVPARTDLRRAAVHQAPAHRRLPGGSAGDGAGVSARAPVPITSHFEAVDVIVTQEVKQGSGQGGGRRAAHRHTAVYEGATRARVHVPDGP